MSGFKGARSLEFSRVQFTLGQEGGESQNLGKLKLLNLQWLKAPNLGCCARKNVFEIPQGTGGICRADSQAQAPEMPAGVERAILLMPHKRC